MAKFPGKCIFCGGSGLSKEHLFSEWLADFFPRAELDTHTFGVIEFNPRRLVSSRSRPGHSGSKKIRKVCTKCNSGWISLIDDSARRALSPIFLGFGGTLTPATQAAIANWIAKIVMVGDAINPEKAKVTQAERDWIRLNRTPPANWQMWIATYAGTEWRQLGIYQHGAWLEIPPIGTPSPIAGYVQASMIGMGQILFLVLGTDISTIGFEVGRINTDMRRIWPIGQSFNWPMPLSLTDEDANSVGSILERLIASPIRGDPNVPLTQGTSTAKE